MSTSVVEIQSVFAQQVTISADSLAVDLIDGRTIVVPLEWFPRLVNGTSEERNNWRLIGNGEGIHWPDLDEDISIEGLIAGKASGESQNSLEKWLESRKIPPTPSLTGI